jgi:EAL domain-containing protein (putative c-di-GMP-specific phosphodiesterase class I)
LSETQYYPNIDRFNAILKTLKELGVLIVIDRLGAINTSFLYLRDLDIDIVRFDPFYIKDIHKYKPIISGYNIMSHLKGIKTWIKMIEDEDTKNLVKELKIDYMQGRYLAHVNV